MVLVAAAETALGLAEVERAGKATAAAMAQGGAGQVVAVVMAQEGTGAAATEAAGVATAVAAGAAGSPMAHRVDTEAEAEKGSEVAVRVTGG